MFVHATEIDVLVEEGGYHHFSFPFKEWLNLKLCQVMEKRGIGGLG